MEKFQSDPMVGSKVMLVSINYVLRKISSKPPLMFDPFGFCNMHFDHKIYLFNTLIPDFERKLLGKKKRNERESGWIAIF